MFKKKGKKAKEPKELLRLDNFIVEKYEREGMRYLRIRTLGGDWCMDFREDTFKYSWILRLGVEEGLHEYLQIWITTTYVHAMSAPDMPYLEQILQAWDGLNERAAELTDEETETADSE